MYNFFGMDGQGPNVNAQDIDMNANFMQFLGFPGAQGMPMFVPGPGGLPGGVFPGMPEFAAGMVGVPGGGDDRSDRPPPASAAAMRSLPKIKVTAYDVEKNETNECVICLDELIIGEPATRIHCGHLFHEDCIKGWLKKSNLCPVCRYELPTDNTEYERGRQARMADRKPRMRLMDLRVKTSQELRRLSEHLGVNVQGCLEKSEFVDCIRNSGLVEIIPEDGDTPDARMPPASSHCSGPRAQPRITTAMLSTLSVRELKEQMTRLGVDFQGCLEKKEMIERLMMSGYVSDDDAGRRADLFSAESGSETMTM